MNVPDERAEMAAVIPLRVDDGSCAARARVVDDLIASWSAEDDVSREAQARVHQLLSALAPCNGDDKSREARDVTAFMDALVAAHDETPVVRRNGHRVWRRVALAGAATLTVLTLATAAGAMPGPAQSVGHDVLGALGIAVPAPDTHDDGTPGVGPQAPSTDVGPTKPAGSGAGSTPPGPSSTSLPPVAAPANDESVAGVVGNEPNGGNAPTDAPQSHDPSNTGEKANGGAGERAHDPNGNQNNNGKSDEAPGHDKSQQGRQP